ncbi:hypothetical protein [Arenimonas alkanexedens]
MPRLQPVPPPSESVSPVLARLLWQWLVLGLLAVAALALARGPAQLPAALSFWLLAAPAASLLTLYRRFLATAWRARLVRATPRRGQLSRPNVRKPRDQMAVSSRRPTRQAGSRRSLAR